MKIIFCVFLKVSFNEYVLHPLFISPDPPPSSINLINFCVVPREWKYFVPSGDVRTSLFHFCPQSCDYCRFLEVSVSCRKRLNPLLFIWWNLASCRCFPPRDQRRITAVLSRVRRDRQRTEGNWNWRMPTLECCNSCTHSNVYFLVPFSKHRLIPVCVM